MTPLPPTTNNSGQDQKRFQEARRIRYHILPLIEIHSARGGAGAPFHMDAHDPMCMQDI